MGPKKIPHDYLAVTAIFFIVWIIYSITLSPGILFEDSGEFALSTFSLGVSHPPGYPLYNLIGRLFQFIPVDMPAFRANMLSAFLGAAGICVLYAAIRRFGFSLFASLVGALACAFSRTVWSQSVIDEVYALNLLLNASLLWSLAMMFEQRKGSGLYAAFFLGLSAVNHYTTLAAFIPAIGIVFLFSNKGGAIRFMSKLAGGSFVMACITLIFSLLPLRAAAVPLMNWKNPQTLELFMEHVKRTQFGHWENQLRFHIPTIMKYASSFVEKLPTEFFAVFLFVGLIGIGLMFSERWKKCVLLLWLGFVQSVGILMYIRFHADDSGLSVVRVFYIGAYMVFSIFIAAGVDGLARQLEGRKRLKTALIAIFIAILCFPLHSNYAYNDLSRASRVDDFGLDLFRYLRRDTVYYLNGSQFTSPAVYNRYIRNKRADVKLIDSSGNLLQEEIENVVGDFEWVNIDMVLDEIITYYNGRRYQAMVYPHLYQGLASGIEMRGPFYYLSDTPGCDLMGWSIEKSGITPEYLKNRDFETRLLPSIMEARLAECDFLNKNVMDGLQHIKASVDALETSSHVRLFAGQLAERYNAETPALESLAVHYYDEALELCPTYTDAIIGKAQLYLEKQKMVAPEARSYVAAEELFRKALKISPGHLQARLSLANIASLNKEYDVAEALYLDLIKQYPQSVLVYNNLANLYVSSRKLDLAEEAYDKARELDPYSSLTLLNVSSFYMQTGRMGYAVSALEKLLSRNHDSAYGHYNMGLALYQIGDYNTAVVHFGKALEYAPGLQQAWENKFLLLLELKRYDEAESLVQDMRNSGLPSLKHRVDALDAQVKERRGKDIHTGE